MASFGKRDRAQYESDFGESWILDDVEKDDRLAQQLSLFTDSHQSQYGPAGYDPPVPREETSLDQFQNSNAESLYAYSHNARLTLDDLIGPQLLEGSASPERDKTLNASAPRSQGNNQQPGDNTARSEQRDAFALMAEEDDRDLAMLAPMSDNWEWLKSYSSTRQPEFQQPVEELPASELPNSGTWMAEGVEDGLWTAREEEDDEEVVERIRISEWTKGHTSMAQQENRSPSRHAVAYEQRMQYASNPPRNLIATANAPRRQPMAEIGQARSAKRQRLDSGRPAPSSVAPSSAWLHGPSLLLNRPSAPSQDFSTLVQSDGGWTPFSAPANVSNGYTNSLPTTSLAYAVEQSIAPGLQPIFNDSSIPPSGSNIPQPAGITTAVASHIPAATTQNTPLSIQSIRDSATAAGIDLFAKARVSDHPRSDPASFTPVIYGDQPTGTARQRLGGDNEDGQLDSRSPSTKIPKRGFVEWEDGIMYTYETSDGQRAEAAYLANIHNEVDVTVDRNGVSYNTAREAGQKPGDVTAYFPAHRTWTKERAHRPVVLFLYDCPGKLESHLSKPNASDVLKDEHGRILLCPNNHPIIDHAGIPLTISTKIGPWLIEAIRRLNLHIGMEDFRARMPHVRLGEHKRPLAHYLSVLVTREGRQELRMLSLMQSKRDEKNMFTRYLREQMNANSQALIENSTERLQDISHETWRKLNKANYGSDFHKAGKTTKVADAKRLKDLKESVALAEQEFALDSVIVSHVRQSLSDYEAFLAAGAERGSRAETKKFAAGSVAHDEDLSDSESFVEGQLDATSRLESPPDLYTWADAPREPEETSRISPPPAYQQPSTSNSQINHQPSPRRSSTAEEPSFAGKGGAREHGAKLDQYSVTKAKRRPRFQSRMHSDNLEQQPEVIQALTGATGTERPADAPCKSNGPSQNGNLYWDEWWARQLNLPGDHSKVRWVQEQVDLLTQRPQNDVDAEMPLDECDTEDDEALEAKLVEYFVDNP